MFDSIFTGLMLFTVPSDRQRFLTGHIEQREAVAISYPSLRALAPCMRLVLAVSRPKVIEFWTNRGLQGPFAVEKSILQFIYSAFSYEDIRA